MKKFITVYSVDDKKQIAVINFEDDKITVTGESTKTIERIIKQFDDVHKPTTKKELFELIPIFTSNLSRVIFSEVKIEE